MKKLISSKKIIQKILIVIIMAILINFVLPTYSSAKWTAGIIFGPIVDFFATVLDVIPAALQTFLVDGSFNRAGNSLVEEDSEGDKDTDIFDFFLVNVEEFDSSKYPEAAYQTGTNYASPQTIDGSNIEQGWRGVKIYSIPIVKYSPDRIFAGKIPAFNINFINPESSHTSTTDSEQQRDTAIQLHDMVASWYVALRNLAIVGLMIILVYVGIRILLSSTASDKSKYKQMLMDWLVAMCLLFFMHYIMAFTITVTQKVTEAIQTQSL